MLLLQLFFVFAVAIACPPGPRGPPGSGGSGGTIQCQTLNATGDVLAGSLTTGIISGSLLSISGQSFLDNGGITTTGQGSMSLNTMFLSGVGAGRGPTLEVDGTTTLDNSQISTSGAGDVFLNTLTIQGSTGPGGGVSLSVTGQTKLDGGLITTNTNGQIHSVDLSVDDTAYLATVVITGGNPQPGYVLTSVDTSGTTTWAPSGSGGGGGSSLNIPRVDLGSSLGNATHRFNNTYTKQLFATTLDIKGDVSIDGILTVNGPTTLDDSGANSITTDGQGNIDIGGTTTLFGITQFDWASSTATSQTDGNGGFMIGGQLQVAGRSTLSNTSVNHLEAAAFRMPTGAHTNAVLISSTDSGVSEWSSLSPFWSDFSPNAPFAHDLGSEQYPWGLIQGKDIKANNTIYAYNGYTSGFHYAVVANGPVSTDNGAFKTDGSGGVAASTLTLQGTATTHNVVPKTDNAYGIGTKANRYADVFAANGFFNNIHVNNSAGGNGITATSVVANSLQINTSPGTATIQGAVNLGTTLTVHGATILDSGGPAGNIHTSGTGDLYIAGVTTMYDIAGFDWLNFPQVSQTDGHGGFLIGGGVKITGQQYGSVYAIVANNPISTDNGHFTTDGGGGVKATSVKASALQITGGSPKTGYVLTATNTSGYAQWQAPIAGCNTTTITSGPCLGGQKITCIDGHGKVTTGNVCPPAPLGMVNASHWTISVPVNFGTSQPFPQIPSYSAFLTKVGNIVTMILPQFITGCNNVGSAAQSEATIPTLPSAFVPNLNQLQYFFNGSPVTPDSAPISQVVECSDDSTSMTCQVQFYPIGDTGSVNGIIWQRSDQHTFACLTGGYMVMEETAIVYYTN